MEMSYHCAIETKFQEWLKQVQENYAYVLCAPECAARQAFEAGYGTAQQEIMESARTDKQQINGGAEPK
jgi:hypothetical protein